MRIMQTHTRTHTRARAHMRIMEGEYSVCMRVCVRARRCVVPCRHDATVPFWTSSVRWHNPYEHDPGAPVSER